MEREGAGAAPLALRDSSVANARGLGNGAGYTVTPTTTPTRSSTRACCPEGLEGPGLLEPTDRGPGGEMAARLRELRARLREDGPTL